MSAVILGILYANFLEWNIHRFLLHKLGKKRNSFWAFHFHDHHRRTRTGNGIDYTYSIEHGHNFYDREIYGFILLTLAHLPLYTVSPIFLATISSYMLFYYWAHVKSHKDIEWAKKWLPWHYDHHMGPNQDKNWCVVMPLCDHIFRTREKYIGTQKYYLDELKRNKN